MTISGKESFDYGDILYDARLYVPASIKKVVIKAKTLIDGHIHAPHSEVYVGNGVKMPGYLLVADKIFSKGKFEAGGIRAYSNRPPEDSFDVLTYYFNETDKKFYQERMGEYAPDWTYPKIPETLLENKPVLEEIDKSKLIAGELSERVKKAFCTLGSGEFLARAKANVGAFAEVMKDW